MALAGGVTIARLAEHRATCTRRAESCPRTAARGPSTPRAGAWSSATASAASCCRRLADALRDGDNIQAVILGSAVNNDGSVKVGFTAPSVNGQAEVIVEALSAAERQPRDDRVRRGARHGHRPRRPGRDRRPRQGVAALDRQAGLLRDRLGEDEHRPPRRRRGRRGPHQDGALPGEPGDPAEPVLRVAEPPDRLRVEPLLRADAARPVGSVAGLPPSGRRERVRDRGHQRSRRARGGTGAASHGPGATVAAARFVEHLVLRTPSTAGSRTRSSSPTRSTFRRRSCPVST